MFTFPGDEAETSYFMSMILLYVHVHIGYLRVENFLKIILQYYCCYYILLLYITLITACNIDKNKKAHMTQWLRATAPSPSECV